MIGLQDLIYAARSSPSTPYQPHLRMGLPRRNEADARSKRVRSHFGRLREMRTLSQSSDAHGHRTDPRNTINDSTPFSLLTYVILASLYSFFPLMR